MIKRIIFAGNNQIAVDTLKFLKKQPVTVVGLVIHPIGFAKKRRELIRVSQLPPERIFQGDLVNSERIATSMKQLRPNLLLSINFRYILKPNILKIPTYGSINLHFGYLPYNRGVFADAWSIIQDTPAGISYHLIDPGIDTGRIIAQKKVEKDITDTGKTLYRKLTTAAYNLFVDIWPKIYRWDFKPTIQVEGGTFHKRADINVIDRIDLEKRYTARELINILRARTFPPYDGAYVTTAEGQKVHLRLNLYTHPTPQFIIRPAARKDCDRILMIRNSHDVRTQSGSTRKITREDHKLWYIHRIRQENYLFLVAIISNAVVGYIRLDKGQTISVAVEKKFRKMGIGNALMTTLLKKVDSHQIFAMVKKTNERSVRFFQHRGFTFEKRSEGYLRLVYQGYLQHTPAQ